MDTIGQRLKFGREKSGLTQRALAEKLGVSQHTIMRWEKDKGCPNAREAAKLAKLLEVTISFLFCAEEAEEATKPQTRSAEDLDQIVKDLAAQDPEIVIRFRNMRQQLPELTEEEKHILLDGLLHVFAQADYIVGTRLAKKGKKGKV